jgi:1-acyl-sn-glycerol-3-phosphate acyltransferase
LKLRGDLALAVISVGLLATDVFERVVVGPWVRLRPERRVPALGKWIHFMAWGVTTVATRIGGARIPVPERVVPAERGHLILMNHQSLWDIPLVVQTVDRGYPRIVTRKRYGRFIPLISHMVRLYQYPVVDPAAGREALRQTLDELERVGREADVPIALFPEGSRSRDGEIQRFRPAGLSRLLAARPWKVHVFVADGFWRAATFGDTAARMGEIDGRLTYAGCLEWNDPAADPGPFMERTREMMVEALAELRAAATAA